MLFCTLAFALQGSWGDGQGTAAERASAAAEGAGGLGLDICAQLSAEHICLLAVILNVASTEELFAETKPSGWIHEEDEAIAHGDGGWSGGEKD